MRPDLTVKDIARDLKRTPATVRSWIKSGQLQARLVHGHYEIGHREYARFCGEGKPNHGLY